MFVDLANFVSGHIPGFLGELLGMLIGIMGMFIGLVICVGYEIFRSVLELMTAFIN